jgi:hypothetical protein
VDEEIVKMEMPESMDFEPFEFQYSNNAWLCFVTVDVMVR